MHTNPVKRLQSTLFQLQMKDFTYIDIVIIHLDFLQNLLHQIFTGEYPNLATIGIDFKQFHDILD